MQLQPKQINPKMRYVLHVRFNQSIKLFCLSLFLFNTMQCQGYCSVGSGRLGAPIHLRPSHWLQARVQDRVFY